MGSIKMKSYSRWSSLFLICGIKTINSFAISRTVFFTDRANREWGAKFLWASINSSRRSQRESKVGSSKNSASRQYALMMWICLSNSWTGANMGGLESAFSNVWRPLRTARMYFFVSSLMLLFPSVLSIGQRGCFGSIICKYRSKRYTSHRTATHSQAMFTHVNINSGMGGTKKAFTSSSVLYISTMTPMYALPALTSKENKIMKLNAETRKGRLRTIIRLSIDSVAPMPPPSRSMVNKPPTNRTRKSLATTQVGVMLKRTCNNREMPFQQHQPVKALKALIGGRAKPEENNPKRIRKKNRKIGRLMRRRCPKVSLLPSVKNRNIA